MVDVNIWVAVAISALTFDVALGRYEVSYDGNPCSPNPCGQNTQCYVSSGRPVCSCLPGHWGNPLSYCQRGECQDNSDCPASKACKDYRCVDVCAGVCGVNSDCHVRNHVPVCSCPTGYKGDPFSNCRLMDPQELCIPSPCGVNTKCDVINNTPTCSCLPGYVGSPLSGCRHECESDYDCPASQSCQNFKCQSACATGVCAPSANCVVQNHRAVCSCPPGHVGDPYVSCRAECFTHSDCPSHKPSCLNAKCVDVCAGVCGVNANCRVRDGTTAVCSCPKDMTGNPFVSCRPFEKTDLCIPNPCGTNARCEPGHDRSGKERPVCTCIPGYLGDPLSYCRRGECSTDNDCRNDQNCINYNCVSSCTNQCGVAAMCNARNHVAVCSCPPGYTGDALTRCYNIPAPVARALYSKK
ncbi:fibropellin-1-like [Macrosteles quadrilineatus]|uniref:fibropellin-1-like n=1 Tax=Macrosteles quadrilineatus TaxID=74068 RepID=UPI0023E209B3|nr:fibropellin-1-like [Macrosteles quadrilineatus]